MPANAKYVGRPTRYANPCTLDGNGRPCTPDGVEISLNRYRVLVAPKRGPVGYWRAAMLAEGYRWWLDQPEQAKLREQIKAELAGCDLACWCPVVDDDPDSPWKGQRHPCHGDVLLEVANGLGVNKLLHEIDRLRDAGQGITELVAAIDAVEAGDLETAVAAADRWRPENRGRV